MRITMGLVSKTVAVLIVWKLETGVNLSEIDSIDMNYHQIEPSGA
jgi:hypothetical protein